MNNKLKKIIKKYKKIVDNELKKHLFNSVSPSAILKNAMNYAVFSGGKRLRPILVLASCKACGGNSKDALPVAAAVEMIHAYSLVHDDLPSMDNDDLRRGKPTTHKKFGEAFGILAGDALLTKAFEIISKNGKINRLNSDSDAKLVKLISQAAGMAGMIGGQAEDIISERVNNKANIKRVLRIHSGKTGALITACIQAGAICAGANKKKIDHLIDYGRCFGLAFQVMDDVLDVIGDKRKLGKKGSDKDNNKLTFPSIWGIEKSINFAKSKVAEAIQNLKIFGQEADQLRWLAEYVVERDH